MATVLKQQLSVIVRYFLLFSISWVLIMFQERNGVQLSYRADFFIVTTEPHSCDLVLLGNYATFSSTLFWEHLMSRRIFMGKSLPLGTEQLETFGLSTQTEDPNCSPGMRWPRQLSSEPWFSKHSWAFVVLIHSRESLNVHPSGGFVQNFWNVRLIHPRNFGEEERSNEAIFDFTKKGVGFFHHLDLLWWGYFIDAMKVDGSSQHSSFREWWLQLRTSISKTNFGGEKQPFLRASERGTEAAKSICIPTQKRTTTLACLYSN